MGAQTVNIPLMAGLIKEVDIKGVFRYCNEYGDDFNIFNSQWCPNWNNHYLSFSYDDALSLVATGKVDVKPLITHKFKIKDTVKAFETAHTGAGNAIKVMIYSKQDAI